MFTVIVACAGAIGATACTDSGNDDPLTIQEYFAKFDEIEDRRTRREALLDEQFDRLSNDEVDAARDRLRQGLDSIREFRDDVQSLEPPPEVEELHDETVQNLTEAIPEFERRLDETGGAQTLEELGAGFFVHALGRWHRNCIELEKAAKENGITVDFYCD